MVPNSGLRVRGFAVGAIREEKLYMSVFSAVALHYFDAYKDIAERIVESIQTRS